MNNSLKERRLAKGLTQAQVAVKVGVSIVSYRMWENGTSKPNDENAKKLEEVLEGEK